MASETAITAIPPECSDWRWQLRNAITTFEHLNHALAEFTELRINPTPAAERVAAEAFNLKVTPAMIAAVRRGLALHIPGTWSAFCASFVPSEFEVGRGVVEADTRADGIGEDLRRSNPVSALSRFYRNRAVLRISHMCPAYCRYCFRRRMVGDGQGGWNRPDVDAAIAFIRSEEAIKEVILSGGEPMLLADERLKYVLDALDAIPHLTRVRIDTKILTMLPHRITDALCRLLRGSKVVAVVGHYTHSYELTPETEAASGRLVDAGIPVYAHIPLLRNVNDDEMSLAHLVDRLADIRVRPYYLIQFIPTEWTEHFRVSIARALELVSYLQRTCGGLAVPTYIVYLPDGHGKVQVGPSHLVGRTAAGYVFRAHDGMQVVYPENIDSGGTA